MPVGGPDGSPASIVMAGLPHSATVIDGLRVRSLVDVTARPHWVRLHLAGCSLPRGPPGGSVPQRGLLPVGGPQGGTTESSGCHVMHGPHCVGRMACQWNEVPLVEPDRNESAPATLG